MTRVSQIVTESDLFVAYKADPAVLALRAEERKERRPCACSGLVTADPIDPAPGVREHQATRRHEAWREANEL